MPGIRKQKDIIIPSEQGKTTFSKGGCLKMQNTPWTTFSTVMDNPTDLSSAKKMAMTEQSSPRNSTSEKNTQVVRLQSKTRVTAHPTTLLLLPVLSLTDFASNQILVRESHLTRRPIPLVTISRTRRLVVRAGSLSASLNSWEVKDLLLSSVFLLITKLGIRNVRKPLTNAPGTRSMIFALSKNLKT